MGGQVETVDVGAAVLRAIADTDTAVWCFVPVDALAPTWQSAAFRRLSVLDPTAPVLPQSLQSASEGLSAVYLAGRRWRADVSVVLDEHGHPVGRLIRLHEPPGTAADDVLSVAQDAWRRLKKLSPREAEILELVYEGLTNKAIAARSSISHKTVEKHRGRISRKMNTASLAELIRLVTIAKLHPEADPEFVPDTPCRPASD